MPFLNLALWPKNKIIKINYVNLFFINSIKSMICPPMHLPLLPELGSYIDAMKDHYSLCFNHSQPTYWPDIYISEGFILHHQIYECRAELGHQYTDWHYSIVLKNATLWGFIIEEEADLATMFVLKRHLNLQVLV